MSSGRILLANLSRNFSKTGKMVHLAEVVENNRKCSTLISSLNAEMSALRLQIIEQKKAQLRMENEQLRKQVDLARLQLIQLETRNGKKQIPIPGVRALSTDSTVSETVVALETAKPALENAKPPKDKKPKKEKPATNATAAAAAPELPIDVGRLDMRIGKIIDVQRHPDADSLYLEKIDCGEAQPRTVVSGLVKFVPIEEMQNRMVVVLCNLKPAKMRGVTSEAMVMCASTPEHVEVLSPPADAVPGDLVHCEGYNRQPDAQLNPKKKIFETCAPDLLTNNELIACYKGAALHVPGKGNIVAQTLKNVNVK